MAATRDALVGGKLEIIGGAVLAALNITNVGGSVAGDTWTLAFDNSTVAGLTGGTASSADIKDRTGAVQVSGLTVGLTNADITLDNLSISKGQSVTISLATIKHA